MLKRLLKKMQHYVKFHLLFPMLLGVEKVIAGMSSVGDHVIFPNDTFPWAGLLEDNWQEIRVELERILAYREGLPNLQDIQEEQQYITRDDKWKTFFLYGYGHKAVYNCEKCPRTTALIEQIPGMLTAFFSILAPQKHIPRHRGLYKGMIRSHLGLIVPGPPQACRMNIDRETVYWQEGKMVVFDNTRFHEVWNDTDRTRVVLLVDIIRPFPAPFSWLNRRVIQLIGHSSYVRGAQRKHLEWEKQFDERVKALKGHPFTPAGKSSSVGPKY